MAVLRASLTDAQVVLASATSCLETWVNAESGKYARIDLSARFGPAEMPDLRTLDMRTEVLEPNRWISPTLASQVQARIDAGEQSSWSHRRGYAPVTICRACGHQIGCDHCDARMVETGSSNGLSAISAARRNRCRTSALIAMFQDVLRRSGRALSVSAKRSLSAFLRLVLLVVVGSFWLGSGAQGEDLGDCSRRCGHHHRHAVGCKGQLPAADAGWRD